MNGVVVALDTDRRLETLEKEHGAFTRLLRNLPDGDWTVLTNSRLLARGRSVLVKRAAGVPPRQLCPGALLAVGRYLPGVKKCAVVDASFPLMRVPELKRDWIASVERARFHPNHGLRNMAGPIVDYLVPPAAWHNKVHGRDMLPEVFELNGAFTMADPSRTREYEDAVRKGGIQAVVLSEVESFNVRTELGFRCLQEIYAQGLHEKWSSGRVELVELDFEQVPA
jgi:hypothetical protein